MNSKPRGWCSVTKTRHFIEGNDVGYTPDMYVHLRLIPFRENEERLQSDIQTQPATPSNNAGIYTRTHSSTQSLIPRGEDQRNYHKMAVIGSQDRIARILVCAIKKNAHMEDRHKKLRTVAQRHNQDRTTRSCAATDMCRTIKRKKSTETKKNAPGRR